MINMQSWMFLSSYEKQDWWFLEIQIIEYGTYWSNGFDSIGGEVVSTTAFILQNHENTDHKGDFLRLVEGKSEAEKSSLINKIITNRNCGLFYTISANKFNKIEGSPFLYWLSENYRKVFESEKTLSNISKIKQGLATCNNEKFRDYGLKYLIVIQIFIVKKEK